MAGNTIKMKDLPSSESSRVTDLIGLDTQGQSVKLPNKQNELETEVANIGSKVGELDRIINGISESETSEKYNSRVAYFTPNMGLELGDVISINIEENNSTSPIQVYLVPADSASPFKNLINYSSGETGIKTAEVTTLEKDGVPLTRVSIVAMNNTFIGTITINRGSDSKSYEERLTTLEEDVLRLDESVEDLLGQEETMSFVDKRYADLTPTRSASIGEEIVVDLLANTSTGPVLVYGYSTSYENLGSFATGSVNVSKTFAIKKDFNSFRIVAEDGKVSCTLHLKHKGKVDSIADGVEARLQEVEVDVDNKLKAIPSRTERKSSNLLNYKDGVEDYTINGSGAFIPVAGANKQWLLLKYLPVENAGHITFGVGGVLGDNGVYNYAFYTSDYKYIAGTYVLSYKTTVETIAVPANAAYICVTYRYDFSTTKHQLNIGAEILDYEEYYPPTYVSGTDSEGNSWLFKPDTSDEELLRLIASQSSSKNIIRVGKGKDVDYNEIQDAIDAISDDSDSNRYIILVMPGVYSRVSMIDKGRRVRYLTIIGYDRRSCIIRDNTGNYNTPPFECLMDGTVSNMSFIMESDEEHYDPYSGNEMAYAMHIDWGGRRTNIFRNCYFESNSGPAVGLGLQANVTLDFEDCEFVRKAFRGDDNGGVFAHAGAGEEPNQLYIFRRCNAYNYVSEASQGFRFRFVSGCIEGYCHIIIQNCGSFNPSGPMAYINGNMLDYRSWGNNCDVLNAVNE